MRNLANLFCHSRESGNPDLTEQNFCTAFSLNPYLIWAKALFRQFIDFMHKTPFSPFLMDVSALSCIRSVWIPAVAGMTKEITYSL
jgi:hypothetical protein